MGRFARYDGPGLAATAPLALARAPRRLTDAVGAAWSLKAPPPTARAAFRLAVAARQDAWRRLRGVRGCAPIAVVRWGEGRIAVEIWAGALDFAPAAPQAVDALREILQESRVKGWAAWAGRAKPAHAER